MKIFPLRRGDRVVASLTELVKKEDIKGGCFLGLGALSSAELMVYDLETKQYSSRKLEGALEVGNFISVIGRDPENNAHIHPHVTLSDRDFKTYCGHLKEGTVGATLEVILFESDQEIQRYADSEIGLNLIK